MREALELYLKATVEEGYGFALPKGPEYHIKNGLLKEEEIAGEYYLTQVEMKLPEMI